MTTWADDAMGESISVRRAMPNRLFIDLINKAILSMGRSAMQLS